ncbi:hypothetical protein B0H14DRAFT_2598600 [Mycena olivaceomarginata]|nr:hypothetical protein B0H14DRAFT_2598600 [Mycena olivaceomarginata]
MRRGFPPLRELQLKSTRDCLSFIGSSTSYQVTVIYAAQGWVSSKVIFGTERSCDLLNRASTLTKIWTPQQFARRLSLTASLRFWGSRSRALRLGSGGLTRDLRVGRVLGFGFWGNGAAIWMQSRALLGSGGLGCDLRVSRSLRAGSGGIKLRSACQSRALVGFRGIKSRSASQSCASFGFWGIKPRSGKSCALFGFWGNKAAICMSVAHSGWVPGD